MKKVTSYIKNLGRSMKYASIDVVRTVNPSINEFIQTNSDLFREINYVVRERRVVINKAKQAFKRSKVYEAGDEFKKALFEDIRSGNLYNIERKTEFEKRGLGFDDSDYDIEASFDFDDESYDEEPSLDISDGDDYIADSVISSSVASAEMISTTVARSSEYIIESQRSMNEYNLIHQIKSFTNVTSVLESINDRVNNIIEFNESATLTHFENTRTYYEETTNIMRESNALLKEMVEMERNLYNKASDDEDNKGSQTIGYTDIISSSGTFDVANYFKMVGKNIADEVSMISTIGGMFGEDSNILLALSGSPLQIIPKAIINKLMGDNLKESISRLDETLSGFFPALMSRFNTMESMGFEEGNPLFEKIGKIFGVKSRLKTTIDTSEYNKGPVPWDGKARQSLIEVIPSLLSKMLAALTGKAEKVYDYEGGKFIDATEIKTELEDTLKTNISSATGEIRDKMEEALRGSYAFRDKDTYDEMTKDIDKLFEYLFRSGEIFDFKRRDAGEYSDLIGISSEDNYKIISQLFGSLPKHEQLGLYKDIMASRRSMTERMEDLEKSGDSYFRYLNNEFNVGEFIDKKGKFDPSTVTGSAASSALTQLKDKYGNTISYYLHKITSTLLEGIKVFVTNFGYGDRSLVPAGAGGGPLPSMPSDDVKTILDRATDLHNLTRDEYDDYKFRDRERFAEKEKERAEEKELEYIEDLSDEQLEQVGARVTIDQDTKRYIEQTKDQFKVRFIDELMEGATIYDKYRIASDKVKSIGTKPSTILANLLDRVDKRLYTIIYGKDDKDEEGQSVKGFLDLLLYNMTTAFDKFNDWMEEKILIPLSAQFEGIGSRILDGIFLGLGMNITASDIKGKVKGFLFGEKDEDDEYISTGVLSSLSDQLKEDVGGIKRSLLGKNFTLRKIYRIIRNYDMDMTRHNMEDAFQLISEIESELKKFKSSLKEDAIIVKNIKEILSRLTVDNADKTIEGIYDELRAGGYGDVDDSVLAFVKGGFDKAKDYVVGDKTVLDVINKFVKTEDLLDRFTMPPSSSEINSNKFISIINILKEFLFKSDFHTKKSMLNTIAKTISDIVPENESEANLKKSLKDIFKSEMVKFNETNPNEIAITLLNKLKTNIKRNNINNILSTFKKIQDVAEKDTFDTDIEVPLMSEFIDKLEDVMKETSMVDTFDKMKGIVDEKDLSEKTISEAISEDPALHKLISNLKSTIETRIGKEDKEKSKVDIIEQLNPLKNITDTIKDHTLHYKEIDEDEDKERDPFKPKGSFAKGLKKVPEDDYPVLVHEGERILTKEEVQQFEEILQILDNRILDVGEKLSYKESNILNQLLKDSDQEGLKTGTAEDTSLSIINKLNTLLSSFRPTTVPEATSKFEIQEILSEFKGDNIETILNKIADKTKKTDIEDDGTVQKDTLLVKVIKEFNSMFAATKKSLFGTDIDDKIPQVVNEQVKDIAKEVSGDFKEYVPKLGSGAILGAGVGLLPGLIGGPLVWGAVGAATALAKHNDKFRELLFGKEQKDGREGGILFSKKTLEEIEKHSPDMKKFGITGAALGLLPFTPVGVVGGLLVGAGAAFAKNSATTQDMLFGETGIIGPEGKSKIEKFLPRAVLSTLGVGLAGKVLTGSMFGPFGLLGGILLGSVISVASTTEKFQSMFLGKDDGKGGRKGGLLGFMRERFLDTTFFIKENILMPVKESLAPFRKDLALAAKRITKGIIKAVDKIFESTFGTKFSTFLQKLLSPIKGTIKLIGKGLGWLGSETIATPFKLLRYVSDSRRIAHAQSDDPRDYSYMTEEEREEILEKDKPGRFLKTMFTKAKRRKDYLKEQEEARQLEGSGENIISDTIDRASEGAKEQRETTNTTLFDILNNVKDILAHIKGKIDERVGITSGEMELPDDESDDSRSSKVVKDILKTSDTTELEEDDTIDDSIEPESKRKKLLQDRFDALKNIKNNFIESFNEGLAETEIKQEDMSDEIDSPTIGDQISILLKDRFSRLRNIKGDMTKAFEEGLDEAKLDKPSSKESDKSIYERIMNEQEVQKYLDLRNKIDIDKEEDNRRASIISKLPFGEDGDMVATFKQNLKEATQLFSSELHKLISVIKAGKVIDTSDQTDMVETDIEMSKDAVASTIPKPRVSPSKVKDTTTMLTTEGELEFERDHKGILKPIRSEVKDALDKERDYDNEWQERMYKAVTDQEDVEEEEGKGGILQTLKNLIPGFIKIVPLLLLALPVLPKILSTVKNIFSFIHKKGIGREGDALEGEVEGGGVISGTFETASQLKDDSKRIAFNLLRKSNLSIFKGIRTLGTKIADSTIGRKVIKESLPKLATGGIGILKKAFTNFFNNPKVIKIIGEGAARAILALPEKILERVGPELVGKIGQKIAEIGTGGVVTVALIIYDLSSGMNNAHKILNMAGTVPFSVRVVSGILNVINNHFTFGLVPKQWLLVNILKLLPGDLFEESIAEGQAELLRMYEKYAEATDDPVSLDKYAKKYEKYNKEAGIETMVEQSTFKWYKPWTWGKGGGSSFIADPMSPSFYAQKDKRWSDTPFNTELDRSKQTIGDSGCGPTSAAMVVSNLTGLDVTPDIASKYAIDHKFKEPDGGVIPEFFESFNELYGIKSDTTLLTGDSHDTDYKNIIENLTKDKPIILMGRTDQESSKTPFTNEPHYVVATGIDGNEIVIDDPQKSGSLKFDLDETLKSSVLSVSNEVSDKHYESKDYVGGEEAFIHKEGGEIDSSGYSGMDPITKILEISRKIIESLLGIGDGISSIFSTSSSYKSGGEVITDATSSSTTKPINNHEFVQKITPGAIKNYEKYGVLPSITVAQAILESGWGKQSIGNNIFGIHTSKSWDGKTVKVPGKPTPFRDYDSIDDSILDHGKVLSQSLYNRVVSAPDYVTAARELQKAGYAGSDYEYADKLIRIIQSSGLDNLDKQVRSGNIDDILASYGTSSGIVTGQTNIHSWYLDRLKKISEDNSNKEIHITSGYRSKEKQKQLWDEHKRKYPNMSDQERTKWVANPEGIGSMHMLGLAADISTQWLKSKSKEELARYGIWRPLSNEPWHFEVVETGYPKSNRDIKAGLRTKYGTPDDPGMIPLAPFDSTPTTTTPLVLAPGPMQTDKVAYDKYGLLGDTSLAKLTSSATKKPTVVSAPTPSRSILDTRIVDLFGKGDFKTPSDDLVSDSIMGIDRGEEDKGFDIGSLYDSFIDNVRDRDYIFGKGGRDDRDIADTPNIDIKIPDIHIKDTNLKTPDINMKDYMYGKSDESIGLIDKDIRHSKIDPIISEPPKIAEYDTQIPKTIIPKKDNSLIKIFIKLLTSIVENTSNLSEIVLLLSKGLKINIPEEKLEGLVKGNMATPINTLLSKPGKVDDNDLANLILQMNAIVQE